MLQLAPSIHYSLIGIIGTISAFAGGVGGGLSSLAALDAINIQPRAHREITKTCLIGLALIETASILALIMAFLLFLQPSMNLAASIAEIGIALSIGTTSFITGIVSSFPVQKAVLSTARQPFFAQKILNLMLITQSIIQTAVILGFLISIFIYSQLPIIQSLIHALSLVAAGLAMSLGAIGPTLGLARFAQVACSCVSINKKSYGRILPFVFMSEAIIETPLIFSFLIALIIIITTFTPTYESITIARMFAASLCIGIGTIAPGLSSSRTASAACQQIACNTQRYSSISQASIFGQSLIDAAAIYALLISLLIIFF
jgi:F-type H+-transporting ATPase subunit c